MPAYFETGFMVRQPAWHGLGEVLPEYPGREEAMRLAGHDFNLIEREVSQRVPGEFGGYALPDTLIPGYKAIVREDDGAVMNVVKDSYTIVQNDVAWDIVDALANEPNVKYETAGVLKGGAVCWVLAYLDEPVQIPGDDSPILPFGAVVWSHDGSGALRCRATSVRIVCSNTESASEAEGRRAGTDFTFRHTKNVMDRINDAKMAIRGIRDDHEEYVELARELATMPVTAEQRELFVSSFIPMPPEALISDRVARNVEDARGAVRALFNGPTIPEAHRFTAYGLHLAGGEYLDHLRGARSSETYLGRSMLRAEPAKAKLTKLIRETVAA